jgi:hypothetical protein
LLTFWFLFILFFKFIKSQNISDLKHSSSNIFNRTSLILLISFFIPMLFSLPYLFSYYKNNISGVQVPLVLNPISQTSSDIVRTNISFNWLLDIPALWLFFSEFGKLLALASLSLILLIAFFILKATRKQISIFFLRAIGKPLFLIYIFMLIIMGYLALTLFLPINVLSNLFDPQRVWQHIFISATILTAVVIFSAIYSIYSVSKRLLNGYKTNSIRLRRSKILASILLALLLIFTAYLISIPAITEQEAIYSNVGLSFNTYETLNQTDLTLMKWITENVPPQAHILISSGDSGQFVSSLTQRQTISRYSYLKNYGDLMGILTSNASDLRAIPLLIEHNVSYIYIGSTATTYANQNPSYRHFNSTQFLTTPYFALAQEYGDAWLFQFNVSAALDEFNNYSLNST